MGKRAFKPSQHQGRKTCKTSLQARQAGRAYSREVDGPSTIHPIVARTKINRTTPNQGQGVGWRPSGCAFPCSKVSFGPELDALQSCPIMCGKNFGPVVRWPPECGTSDFSLFFLQRSPILDSKSGDQVGSNSTIQPPDQFQ
jgi:hypothetical protein